MVFHQLKMFVLSIVGILRRLCCFARRRKMSATEQVCVGVVVDGATTQNRSQKQFAERDWNSWDDTPRTVEEHIEQYRQRIGKSTTPQREEPEPDFFSEITPVIKPQPKFYLAADDTTQTKTDFSRLEAKTDVPIAMNAELEDWNEESIDAGWEELDAQQAKQLIREKRREMRNQRQKAHKAQKCSEMNASPLSAGNARLQT